MELLWPITDWEIRERALRWAAENRGKKASERAQRLRLLRRSLWEIFARNPDLPKTFLRYLAWAWCIDLLTLETMWEAWVERRATLCARLKADWLPMEDRILLAHERNVHYAVRLLNRYEGNVARAVIRTPMAARRRLRILKHRLERKSDCLIV